MIGQLWEPLRPFTIFYYYQPQPMILNAAWAQDMNLWRNLGVLPGISAAGYAAAWWHFCRSDLSAPL